MKGHEKDMKIFIADDHILFSDALKAMLERMEPRFDVNHAQSVNDALTAVDDMLEKPALILLDLKMPGMNGLDGMVLFKKEYPDIPVVIMSGLATRDDITRCLDAGAAGFLPKTLRGDALVSAINLILAGERFVPYDKMTEDNLSFNEHEIAATIERQTGREIHITKREKEILGFLTKGASNKEIARDLGISVVTVKLHVKNICQKFRVKNRTQAAMKAHEMGIVFDGR